MGEHDGYFPRGESVLRQVHEQRIVGLLYGQRALMIGATDPVVSSGTYESSAGTGSPFDRLVRTAKTFEITFLGSKAEADRELERVYRLHQRVKGGLTRDAGPYPAGTRYDALDPKQMLWTLAVIADSALVVYERLVRPLSEAEREAFWRDYVRWGELFRLPSAAMPPTYGEFRAWYDVRLESDELFLTDESREMGHIVALEIPGPRQDRPALVVHNLLVAGLLPKRVRELYGLRWTPAHAAAFRAAVAAHRATHRVAPDRVRRGRVTRFYDRVAHSERHGLASGQQARGAAAADARRASAEV
jgi:uncharacterized protein (DUF2236 family)